MTTPLDQELRRPGITKMIERLRHEFPKLDAQDITIKAKILWSNKTIIVPDGNGDFKEVPNPDYMGGQPE